MSRHYPDWIKAFIHNTGVVEAPKLMLFWAGVSAVAGCLRRKVWLDFKRYQWYPNFYIVFVAPPGIISKSTTADLSMDILRMVPGIKFGPDIVTWPALVQAFANSCESFQMGEEWYPMSPLTLVASEFGNLINPADKELVNLYIQLWDGRKSLEKVTKGSGVDIVEAPWINLLGCTTPHWIADNMPSATVGGGFTSRCVFVYADKKENFIAYADESVAEDYHGGRERLAHDLEHIATNLCGEYKLSPDAREWGREWYKNLWGSGEASGMDNDRLDGYIARKQTHMHKLAMVLAAARSDELLVTLEDLTLAEVMLNQTETDLDKVFSRIGRTDQSLHAEQFISVIRSRKAIAYSEAYKAVYNYFPDFRDFEGIVAGALRSGHITMEQRGNEFWLIYKPGVVNA